MARLTDTRTRTREIAQALLKEGHQAHDLTVDSIYCILQQGSRSTINSELKLWKNEQSKAQAIGAQIPAELSQAVVALWELAKQKSESVFNAQRDELDEKIEWLNETLNNQKNLVKDQTQQTELALQKIQQQHIEIEGLRQQLGQEQALKNSALLQEHTLKNKLNESQAENKAQQIHFEQEIAKTTERLEAVQHHVLREVSASREAQKQAELNLEQLQRSQQTERERHFSEREQLRQSLTETQTELALQKKWNDQINAEKRALLEQLTLARQSLLDLKKEQTSHFNGVKTLRPLRKTLRRNTDRHS